MHVRIALFLGGSRWHASRTQLVDWIAVRERRRVILVLHERLVVVHLITTMSVLSEAGTTLLLNLQNANLVVRRLLHVQLAFSLAPTVLEAVPSSYLDSAFNATLKLG